MVLIGADWSLQSDDLPVQASSSKASRLRPRKPRSRATGTGLLAGNPPGVVRRQRRIATIYPPLIPPKKKKNFCYYVPPKKNKKKLSCVPQLLTTTTHPRHFLGLWCSLPRWQFGKGAYFADEVSKSANYCFTDRDNSTGLLLLCDVEVRQPLTII